MEVSTLGDVDAKRSVATQQLADGFEGKGMGAAAKLISEAC